MSSLNQVAVLGRLVRDVELKKSKTGLSYCQITLAVDDFVKNNKVCYFIPVNVIGKTADAVEKYCKKGDRIAVSGKITQKSIAGKDGKSHSYVSVIANNVEFLNPKADTVKTKTTTKTDDKKKESDEPAIDTDGLDF